MKHFVLYYDWFDSLKCDAYFETNICCVSGQSVSLDTSKAKGAAISQMTRLPPTLPPSCLRMVYIVSVSPHPPPPLFHTGTSVVGSDWVGVGREWLAHTNLNSALLLSVCDHIQEERTNVFANCFFLFFSSLLSGFRPEAGWRDLKSKRNDNI